MTRLLLVTMALGLSTTALAIPGMEDEDLGEGADPSSDEMDFPPLEELPDYESYIVNGREAQPGEFPETVFISSGGSCTGSVIDPDGYWVLTAAHCIKPDTPDTGITVSTGVRPGDGVSVTSKRWIRNQNWDDNDVASQGQDIAVIELSEPIDVFPMAINDQDMDDSWIDLDVTIMGYGKTATSRNDGGTKRIAETKIFAIGEDAFPDDSNYVDQVLYYNGDQDTCQGDSGGPSIVYSGNGYVQVGITSYGPVPCGSGPSGYIRTDKYIGWLRARGVPFTTRPGSPPDFVCSRRLDDENENSVSLGVVPFDLKCQVDYHTPDEISSVSWQWGDGGSGEGLNAEHVYERAGNFSIRMCASGERDGGEWTHCVNKNGSVTACDVPEAGFEVENTEGLEWQVINKTNVSTYGCITNLVWEVYNEDGEMIDEYGGWEPTLLFDEPGEYRIVQNIGGFAGDDAAEVTIDVKRRVGGCNSVGAYGSFGGLAGFGLVLGVAAMRRRNR